MGDEIPASEGQQSANLVPSETGSEAKNFDDRIARYGKAKSRSVEMANYLSADVLPKAHPAELERLESIYGAIRDCGSYLMFRDYHGIDDIRLIRASFCRRHLICPFCAIRRGAKLIQAYDEKFMELVKTDPNPALRLVTLTVKNGEDLNERFDHLVTSLRALIHKRKTGLHRGSGGGEFAKIRGGAYSIEFTNRGNGWHPHVHILALCSPGQEIYQTALAYEWHQCTDDSYIVDVSDIDDPINGFMEVFKYAVKFSDLTVEQNWHAFDALFGRRLIGSFGDFYGVKIPDKLEDDKLENQPYTDRFFNYIGGSKYLEREL